MKIESCFKILGQVNKIYTTYEVLLVDIKLTLCSFLLISALCHFFSNPLSFCSWVCCHVCQSCFHLCSRCPSPCSAPLPICLLPHHPMLQQTCILLCHSAVPYICTLHFITVRFLFIFCLEGDTPEQRSPEDWQGGIDRVSGIQPLDANAFKTWVK